MALATPCYTLQRAQRKMTWGHLLRVATHCGGHDPGRHVTLATLCYTLKWAQCRMTDLQER